MAFPLSARALRALLCLFAIGCTPLARSTPPAHPAPPAGAPAAAPPQASASREEILAASDLPGPLPRPLTDDPMGATIHRLSNGLTVYISTDRERPRIAAWIAVRAGSRHDPPSSTGLAHYLEHMLFKGTRALGTLDYDKEQEHLRRIEALYASLRATRDEGERRKILAEIDAETQKSAAYAVPNELDRLYATLGVTDVNAFTSNDQTVYVADVPSNRFRAWAAVEADRFAHPSFRLFFPELEAVYEEKNRALDSPFWRVNEVLMRAVYPGHPYGTQDTLGHIEHLKTPAYADMVAFYRRWYVPNNMAIALAGDIDAAAALPVLEEAFAGLAPAPLPRPEGASVPPPIAGRTEHVVRAEGETSVSLAWRTVPRGHADELPLEVMDWLVDNATSGLLNIELVLTQKLPAAGSAPRHLVEAGHWQLRGTAREGQSLEEVERLLLGVVEKVKKGEFTREELEAVVTNAEIREKRALESNGSRVARMADAFVHRQEWPLAATRLARLRRVTREDVVRVANRYLGPDYVVVRRVKGTSEPPKVDKPRITPVALDTSRESAFARAIKSLPADELTPQWLEEGKHYERRKLPAGPMVAVRNPRNDLFSLSYEFELGSKRQRLLCHALDLLDRAGAEGLSPEDLKRKLYAMGTTIQTSCGADASQLSVSGLDDRLEESVRLLERWLRTAAFTEETRQKLVENTRSQRKDRMDEPNFVAAALHAYAARGGDSPYLKEPSDRELERARGAELRRLLAALPDHQHRTSYFGPRSGAEAARVVALGRAHRKVAPRDPVRYRRVRQAQVYFAHKKVSQAQVRVAFPGKPLAAPERPLSELYSAYVGGGMNALVFQEIREARGLAYSAGARHVVGARPRDESLVIGAMGTQNDKTVEALSALLGLLRRFEVQPPRLGATREALDQEYRATRFEPRSTAGLVWRWLDLGERGDPRPRYWQEIRTLQPAALHAFGNRIASAGLIVSVMGDRERIDVEALSKEHGPLETVEIGALVSYDD